jgi:hypothetical protein
VSEPPDSPYSPGLIDLHSHTNESDGSFTPEELVRLAKETGLDALGITDHDTIAGYTKALPFAHDAGLDLVCGIELNTKLQLSDRPETRSVHLLAYFPVTAPSTEFMAWLLGQQDERRRRNRDLVEALKGQGIDISLSEIEARGRSLAGRPHFARILVEKGYAADHEDAFLRFIGEDAPSFVQRQSIIIENAIQIVRQGGGVSVIAHPIRLQLQRDAEEKVLARLKQVGLAGLEVYHSEHSPEAQAHYRQLAEKLELLPTGGSDFHGRAKPNVKLGAGLNGNLRVPRAFLDGLRQYTERE